MNKTRFTIALFFVCLLHAGITKGQTGFTAGKFAIAIDGRGRVTSLFDVATRKEYLASQLPAWLLLLRVGGKSLEPEKFTFDPATGIALLKYARGSITAAVKIVRKTSHITFELVAVLAERGVDAVLWGPYPTTISGTVGEIVGVVRNGMYAIGIQALNVKTLGGTPLNDEGVEPSRGRAAEAHSWGSTLQAYSMDRSRPRRIDVWQGSFPAMPVPPIPGETVIGSKIALFGCPDSEALATIGAIELAEGLPHPLIDGVWSKLSPMTGRSYLIADFSEETIDELLTYTRRANLMSLYHGGPFASWGHYQLNPMFFPHGKKGLRSSVEKAKAVGIRLGGHTLTNFINTNDPYVTPVPDSRLAMTGSSHLTQSIDSLTTTIPVAAPAYFANEKANWLHTVMIDHELIRYRGVSASAPWNLTQCERGAFGTRPAAHTRNRVVAKLLDHPYNVFFPNIDLQTEIASTLAKRFNETGLSQLDFDGREGCWASGEGDYAQDLFVEEFYDAIDHEIINGTSTSTHFYWHINTYCNWGEPWYGGFRESMQDYRIKNQDLFARNYLPHMLGWYQLTETTSLAEMEWMLARAAGYDAGFALATNLDALRKNPDTGILLDAVREWESARGSRSFTPAEREMLKDPKREYHLEAGSDSSLHLIPFHSSPEYMVTFSTEQPGGHQASRLEFENPDSAQAMQFRLEVAGDSGIVRDISLMTDAVHEVTLPLTLKTGESLVIEGTSRLRVYDTSGRQSGMVQLRSLMPLLASGKHFVDIRCESVGARRPDLRVTFKTRGAPVRVAK